MTAPSLATRNHPNQDKTLSNAMHESEHQPRRSRRSGDNQSGVHSFTRKATQPTLRHDLGMVNLKISSNCLLGQNSPLHHWGASPPHGTPKALHPQTGYYRSGNALLRCCHHHHSRLPMLEIPAPAEEKVAERETGSG